ncbi:ATP-binding protein [Spongiactinospora sp. 9N601]|uniref:ATP-binding protein n=1 Tax=Spongiactinospora sp. 9N601 TaxID=3375149 RepID=UPI003790B33A
MTNPMAPQDAILDMSRHYPTHPENPTASMEVTYALPAEEAVVGKARRLVEEILGEWGMASIIDDVTVVVSELVTNALRHASGPITLTLQRHDGGLIRGVVTDYGGDTKPHLKEPGPDEEGGRGLYVVRAYVDRWGVTMTASGGALVWFEKAAM